VTFLDEIAEARMNAYKATLGGDWEKELEEAYKAVKAHLLLRARLAIKHGDLSNISIESTDADFPKEACGLGRQLTTHLVYRLREDGLVVETYQDRSRLAFRVFLPEIPSLIREALG
jgi:hypothetical protein